MAPGTTLVSPNRGHAAPRPDLRRPGPCAFDVNGNHDEDNSLDIVVLRCDFGVLGVFSCVDVESGSMGIPG